MRNFPKGESFQNVAGNFINAITELIQQTRGKSSCTNTCKFNLLDCHNVISSRTANQKLILHEMRLPCLVML